MFLPDSLPKLDWETYDSFDTTKQWEAFAIFLERRGVFLFGTDAYRNAPLAPFNPPASPFSATRDEDFIYRGSPSQGRRKSYWHAHPFCRYAVDDLGRDLYVKAVPKASDEWRILEFLTSPELRDPANHTIPIVSVLHHPDGETVFLIQAKWGSEWLWPDLESMNERYMVAHQLLEGLAFMHRNGIGHGDLHVENVVWNYHDVRDHPTAPNYRKFERDFDFRLAFIDFEASVCPISN